MEQWLQTFIATALGSAIAAGLGAYVGAYLRKKGENLATHEDIEKLVEQVRSVTQATKEIEAKISNEMWHRQRQWELRRDVIFEAARHLSEVQVKFSALVACAYTMSITAANSPTRDTNVARKLEASNTFHTTFLELLKAIDIASLVCGSDVRKEFENVEHVFLSLNMRMSNNEAVDPSAISKEFKSATEKVISAIRKELDIEALSTLATLQSSVSSVAPNPD